MSLKPFKSIGIGVAYSPNLKANLFEAARLSVFFESKLFFIHVGEPSEDKINMLSVILKSFEKDNLDYEVVFKTGNPVNVILSALTGDNFTLRFSEQGFTQTQRSQAGCRHAVRSRRSGPPKVPNPLGVCQAVRDGLGCK